MHMASLTSTAAAAAAGGSRKSYTVDPALKNDSLYICSVIAGEDDSTPSFPFSNTQEQTLHKMNGTKHGNGSMASSRDEECDDEFIGQVEILDTTFAFAKSMALKSAIMLGVPDVLAASGGLLSLEEIAKGVKSKNTDFLSRILRFLAKNRIFCEEEFESEDGKVELKYGLTRASKWLVRKETSFAPFAIMQLDKALQAPWHHFHECVLLGGDDAFARAHGKNIWSFASENPGFNDLFNKAMVSSSMICTESLLKHYKGFEVEGLETLVDVGGGLGLMISKIIAAYPRIRGINFDLPHVIATAPSLPGVEHVGGDMFEEVPRGDAIIMKWIMHDWDDDRCTKILGNCRSALPDDGKLIIVEAVLDPTQATPFSNVKMVFDLLMIAHAPGGRERTQDQWIDLLNRSGFPIVKIHSIPNLQSVIEAFKQ